MKKTLCLLAVLLVVASNASAQSPQTPNQKARVEFADAGLGIFIHWGIYSMFGQGEWYLHTGGLNATEYAKAASGFYPSKFDAEQWVKAIKESGARYICFTSRHHDGFSMFATKQSSYNVVDATPWGRDIVGELAKACTKEGLKLHLYYSHADWTRTDYPQGRTGHLTGRDPSLADWPSYFDFMKAQLTELLTHYGPIGAIWFDGVWDHDEDATPFDWHLKEQYDLIHNLQASCLVANNHHLVPFEGEDIQVFERDVPGENTAGYSGENGISQSLPLETCQTMNGSWGYRIKDQDYKSPKQIIQYLVKTRAKGANLLLNVGPQPNGEIPAAALERLKVLGEWMKQYGETIYGARGSAFAPQSWGVSTCKDDKIYLHILSPEVLLREDSFCLVQVPELMEGRKVLSARFFGTEEGVEILRVKGLKAFTLKVPEKLVDSSSADTIITLNLSK